MGHRHTNRRRFLWRSQAALLGHRETPMATRTNHIGDRTDETIGLLKGRMIFSREKCERIVCPPCGSALLLLGFSSTSWAGNALPMSLGFAGFTGCSLYTSIQGYPAVVAGTADLNPGYAHFDIPVALNGPLQVTLCGQWMVLGSGPSFPGALSGGLSWQH